MYRALIRSQLDYGCVVYNSACKSLLKKLDSIQCTALSFVTGAMRGTALSSLLRDCGEYPLSMRRDFLTCKYLAKISSNPMHISNEVTKKSAMKQLSITFPCRRESHLKIVKSLAASDIIGGDVTSLNPPWTSKVISTDLYFKSSLDLKAPTKCSSLQMEIVKYLDLVYPLSTLIYTDGSCSTSGRAAAAVFIPSLNITLSYRLTDFVRIELVELDAIFSAISIIILHRIINPVIITDSLSIVMAFSNGSIFDNVLVHICRNLVSSNNISLSMIWVPSHIGLVDHDSADLQAKRALELPSINRVSVLDFVDVCSLLKHHYLNEWNGSISSLSTGRSYHGLFPKGRSTSELIYPRKKDTVISRLRFHNCRLNKYLHKIGIHPSGLCDICNIPEDVDHFVFNCIKHVSLTSLLKSAAFSNKSTLSLKLVLSHEPFLSIIYNYISVNNVTI